MTAYSRVKSVICFIILSELLSGCSTVSVMKKSDSAKIHTEIWHQEPSTKEVKAVVLLLHGLNLRPAKMDDWAALLSDHGGHVVRFALYGHTGDYQHMKEVGVEIWRHQFQEAFAVARAKAEEYGVPIYFVGFSLGALAALEWIACEKSSTALIEKMVLIAPALSIPWYSKVAINTLGIFGRGLMLPSRSPESYRANKGTSIAAYQALFALKDSLEKKKYKNANVSTLVIIDREDELVDSRGILKIIKEFKLSSWKVQIVDNRFAYDNYGFRHLMVDQAAIGKNLWQTLNGLVIDHLNLKE